jgi:hypothetical protein
VGIERRLEGRIGTPKRKTLWFLLVWDPLVHGEHLRVALGGTCHSRANVSADADVPVAMTKKGGNWESMIKRGNVERTSSVLVIETLIRKALVIHHMHTMDQKHAVSIFQTEQVKERTR